MVNFELDPHRFLPRGQAIIDGGALYIPRTFVTPSHFVPDQFESFCVAVVELEPLAQDLHDLLHLARDCIIGLGYEVINFQSWFYGVGLYQMRSPVARAALFDHPLRGFRPNHFIRFENQNEGPGQPLVGRFTGMRRSLTAPVYILTSEFADVILANEDPMHVDENPHPLPGGFVPDNNMFVLPEYPANGWNEAPIAPQPELVQPVDPVNTVMMNEQPDAISLPPAILEQAYLLAQQLQDAAMVNGNVVVQPKDNVATPDAFVAHLEENVVVVDGNVAVQATVDVLMEFQLEENMGLQQ
ncbi:hypothetical protein ACQ4PT_042016 [Festuca glaucescens]